MQAACTTIKILVGHMVGPYSAYPSKRDVLWILVTFGIILEVEY